MLETVKGYHIFLGFCSYLVLCIVSFVSLYKIIMTLYHFLLYKMQWVNAYEYTLYRLPIVEMPHISNMPYFQAWNIVGLSRWENYY